MNQSFILHLQQSHLSMYRLAKISGVPYTTISELSRGLLDINKCSLEAVNRMALALDTSMESLMNPYYCMDKKTGKTQGISYQWKEKEGGMHLLFTYDGKQQDLDANCKMMRPEFHKEYELIAEMLIDLFIKRQRFYKGTA